MIIKLELRGKMFKVDRDVLMNVPGTYFSGMLSSGAWQPNGDGVYVIDRPSEGFDRILECLSTGKLNCSGLNEHEVECVYANLDYFLIPYTREWDYTKVNRIEGLDLMVRLVLNDGRLCGSPSYKSVCIYNMDTSAIERRMDGHTDYICGIIQLKDGRICSCSWDKTIKLWNFENGTCELTLTAHKNKVLCIIQLSDGRLCSGSSDGTIRLWLKDSKACKFIIGTADSTYSLIQLKDSRLCSVNESGQIRLWDLKTGLSDTTINGNSGWIWAIEVADKQSILSCSRDETMALYNPTSGVCEKTSKAHTNMVRDMILLLDGRLCSVSEDGTLKICNMETGVFDLDLHVSGNSLYKVIQSNDGRLVVCDIDNEVFVIGA
jgi:WD40 repeat protein